MEVKTVGEETLHKLKAKIKMRKTLKNVQKDNTPDTQMSVWDPDFYILQPDRSSLGCLLSFQTDV